MSCAIVTADPAVRLRLAAPADQAFIRNLFDDVRAESLSCGGLSGATLRQLLDQQFRLQTDSHARQYPNAVSLIIERHAAPIGHMLIDCGDRRWHVIDLALLAAGRGQGVGTMVLQGVAAAARARNVSRLTLMVPEANIGACRLYARLGFAETAAAAGSGYLALAKRLKT